MSDLTHAHRSAGAHRDRPALTVPTQRVTAAGRAVARRAGRTATATTRATRAGTTAAFAFAFAVVGPPARAAWNDARTLAGYWPGLAGLACLVRAATELGPGPGWAAGGVALLLIGAVART